MNGRTRILARDSVPPQAEFDAHRYKIGKPGLNILGQGQCSPSTGREQNLKQIDDEEIQKPLSVAESGRLIHRGLFGPKETNDDIDIFNLLPRHLGPALLTGDAETSIGWGIEIVEGPSRILDCLKLISSVIIPLFVWAILYSVSRAILFLSGTRSDTTGYRIVRYTETHRMQTKKPTIDICFITAGASFLVFVLIKGSRIMEARH